MICNKCGKEFDNDPVKNVFCSKKCYDCNRASISYYKHREKRLEYCKQDHVKARQSELLKTKKYKLTRSINNKKKRNEDILWKLYHNVKDRIRKDTITNFSHISFSKENLTNYLGYTIEELAEYLFINDELKKSYLNKELELDHIIPYNRFFMLSAGDEEFKKCWNFRNLRLISGYDNKERKKKNFPWEEVFQYGIQDLLPKGPDKIWEEKIKFHKLNTTDYNFYI